MTDSVRVSDNPRDEWDPSAAAGASGEVAEHHVVLLDVGRSIDAETAPRVAGAVSRALQDNAPEIVVCDFSEVDFLAVSGLRVLIDLDDCARSRDVHLRLVFRHPAPLRLIELTRAEHRLAVFADRHAALTHTRPHGP